MDRHDWLQHPVAAFLDSAQILPYICPAHTEVAIPRKYRLQVPKSDGALRVPQVHIDEFACSSMQFVESRDFCSPINQRVASVLSLSKYPF